MGLHPPGPPASCTHILANTLAHRHWQALSQKTLANTPAHKHWQALWHTNTGKQSGTQTLAGTLVLDAASMWLCMREGTAVGDGAESRSMRTQTTHKTVRQDSGR